MSQQLSDLTEVVSRLNLIVALLLEQSEKGRKATTTSRIMKLSELGASPSEIAQILRKPLSYVTASMAMRRRAGRHD
jgi:hypothetical protein